MLKVLFSFLQFCFMRWKSAVIMLITGMATLFVQPLTAAHPSQSESRELTTSSIPDHKKDLDAFRSLDRKERKARFKAAKSVLRTYKKDLRRGLAEESDASQVLLIILGILVPPLAIYLKERTLGWPFWASIALLATGLIVFSALPFFWLLAAGLALLVVFEVI